ncbi:MAG: heavy-metal-associated domain-containing protein [Gammaproteobacteria bacterium]
MSSRVHLTLRIEGMTCVGRARHVTQALKGAPGVQSAEVGAGRSEWTRLRTENPDIRGAHLLAGRDAALVLRGIGDR